MKFEIKDASKIKLVVWDLDETFWNGTLSDNDTTLEPILENIELVKKLTNRGIVNAVCSKNDREEAEKELKKLGVSNYFVFNSINWEPKGQRLKNMLSAMALRPTNVLILDDNHSNLAEAEFVLPDIMVGGPDVIPELYKVADNLGKDDSKHSRLNQYKVLERKHEDSSNYSSNEEFLRQSNIRVSIKFPDEKVAPRIVELIQRSNQLNFTKKRIGLDELHKLMKNPDYTLGYVSVSDNYGKYGIVGFYALKIKGNELEHFLFSCRTMGMGIEQYVYSFLGYPKLDIVGPVSGEVSEHAGFPDYITKVDDISSEDQKDKIANKDVSVLLKGPCDLEVMASYLEGQNIRLDKEFNFIDSHGNQADYRNHLINIIDGKQPFVTQWCNKYSFLSKEGFETQLFSGKYDIICLSPLMDATLAVYEDNDGHKLAYGLYSLPLSDRGNISEYLQKKVMTARCDFSKDELIQFANEFHQFEYSAEDILNNLLKITNKLKSVRSDIHIVILLLSELEYKSKDPEYMRLFGKKHQIHKEINNKIRVKFKDCDFIYLLDVNKYINNQDDYFDNINHYSKFVYYEMAQEFAEYIDSISNAKVGTSSRVKMRFQNMKRMLYKKLFVK